MKTKINCSVTSCIFNYSRICDANEITVGCNCNSPVECSRETECVSFRKRAEEKR